MRRRSLVRNACLGVQLFFTEYSLWAMTSISSGSCSFQDALLARMSDPLNAKPRRIFPGGNGFFLTHCIWLPSWDLKICWRIWGGSQTISRKLETISQRSFVHPRQIKRTALSARRSFQNLQSCRELVLNVARMSQARPISRRRWQTCERLMGLANWARDEWRIARF